MALYDPFGRRITRRGFIRGTSSLAGAGLLCAGGMPLSRRAWAEDAAGEFAAANIDWKQASGTTLVLAGLQHPWMEAVVPLLPQFTELTGIEVEVEQQSESEYIAEIPIKLGGGNATPDVFMVWSPGQAIAGGWVDPLNQHYDNADLFDGAWYNEADIFDSARSFPVWNDGERYVVSITAEAQTLFLNQTLLDENGMSAPKTFDEMYEMAVAMNSDLVSGIAMRAKATGDAAPWPAGGFVFSYGGEIINADGVCVLDSPEAIAAMDMYTKLLRDAGPLGVGSYHWYECLNDFMQGATAMGCDSSNFATDIENPEKSSVAGQALFGEMPSAGDRPAKANMWHWMAGMNARSENKVGAFLFLTWVTSQPTCAIAAAAGLATPRSSAWRSDGFRNAFGGQAADAALANLEGADGDLMKACWFHPQSAEILDPWAIGISEVISGDKDAETAMREVAVKVNEAIAG